MDYMSKFKFDITYIKGDLNKVADCLSQYYESDTMQGVHMYNEYICADACIDPAGEDLPAQQFKEMTDQVIEIQAMWEDEWWCSTRLHKRKKQWDKEAEKMAQAKGQEPQAAPTDHPESNKRTDMSDALNKSTTTLADVLYNCPNNSKSSWLDEDTFKQCIQLGYKEDKLLSLVIEKPVDYLIFTVQDNLVWKLNLQGDDVLCVPRNCELILKILNQAHKTMGHFGSQHTNEYIWQ